MLNLLCRVFGHRYAMVRTMQPTNKELRTIYVYKCTRCLKEYRDWVYDGRYPFKKG